MENILAAAETWGLERGFGDADGGLTLSVADVRRNT